MRTTAPTAPCPGPPPGDRPLGAKRKPDDSGRYLNPDVLIDSTSCRWKMKKSSIVGIATTVEAAMMPFWAEASCCWKLRDAEVLLDPLLLLHEPVAQGGGERIVGDDRVPQRQADPADRVEDGGVEVGERE